MDAFFVARKFVAWLAQPSTFLVLVFSVTALLAMFREPRAKWLRRTAAASGTILLVLAFTPASAWMLASLERRFAEFDPATLQDPPLAIIVLGGVTGQPTIAGRPHVDLKDGTDRIRYAATLARQFPQAKVILSGGGASSSQHLSEAEAMAAVLAEFGIDAGRIVLETKSRTTSENANNVRPLLPEGRAVLLVTSASHMPRAMAIFKDRGVNAIAAPTDWQISDGDFGLDSAAASLAKADAAVHEYLGLMVYRW